MANCTVETGRGSAEGRPLEIAVIGTGIAGMAAAWLLSQRHRVTVYESDSRIGGHTNTVDIPCAGGSLPVDTGFIVYNEVTYPNLTALFEHLEVPTRASEMSFAISLDDGRLEYSGTGLAGLFAQKRNLLSPRFWSMLGGIRRFYRDAPRPGARPDESVALGDYLERNGYSAALIEDHLLPMAAAIWSAPRATMRNYPALSFISFCENHALLSLGERPLWRTVVGGARTYAERLTAPYADRLLLSRPVRAIVRREHDVLVEDGSGKTRRFDQIVIAAHADQALGMLADADEEERRLLGAFRYQENSAILHRDPALMPKRRAVWSSWNYVGSSGQDRELSVSYWLNRLQGLPEATQAFVTLNPQQTPSETDIFGRFTYHHPIFDCAALRAQRALWRLQARRRTWFCGAYFGAGFHEDGLQSGLAVAEQLGGLRRPWTVPDESGRIALGHASPLSSGESVLA
jgi:hypothetical protein